MALPKLHIKNQQEIRIVMGHPWVYSNEIANFAEAKNLESGSLVEIHIPKHSNAFALAYFNPHQLIAARILSYNFAEIIDETFFVNRLFKAKNLREKFFSKPFYRLIHSEADGLPGLVVDRFDNVFSCQITTAGMEKMKALIILALQKTFPKCAIIFRNDVEARKFEGLQLEENDSVGEISDEIIIEENELKYSIDAKTGQKTGWFFDQRANRDFIAKVSKDANVLDAFCYQGGFGVNALKGGAKSVTFIDSSKEALEKAKINVALNFPEQKSCEFICDKVFETLEKLAAANKQFGVIVLDPPAFVKSKKDLFAGLRGYEKLVRLALPLLKENGILLLASCSHNVTLPDLIEAANNGLRKGLAGSGRSARMIRTHGTSFDHPIHPALKESEYLKSIAFMV